ncbi:hypothetical protein [Nonomuraea typhae]|uniref:DUF222 domain-containing protein n=1 Tax=Nonomuraea typhae TaxID=2603600 RepID=A0ABW7Z7Y1_9ACTN
MREWNDEADGVLDAVEAELHALVTRLSRLAGARGREVVQAGLDAVGALRQIAEADGPGSPAYGITAEALARAAWNRAGTGRTRNNGNVGRRAPDGVPDPTPDGIRDAMRDGVSDPMPDPMSDPVRDGMPDPMRDGIRHPTRDPMRDKVLGQARLDVAYLLSRLARAARAPRGQRVPLARPYAYWKEYRAHGGAA